MKRTLLIVSALLMAMFANAQSCTEFFFSEYVEGTSQNKAMEIYNPTAAPKNLSGYFLNRYSNGGSTVAESLALSGIVPAYGTWVVTNGQLDSNSYGFIDSVLYNMGNQHGSGVHGTDPLYYNGNDAITLEMTGGVIVDVFGHVGAPDPGSGWYDQPGPNGDYTTTYDYLAWSVNHTLIRKPTVLAGITTNPTPFIVNLEWDSLPENTWSHLGSHTCNCNPNAVKQYDNNHQVYFFPNPVINKELTIKGNAVIGSVEIYNVIGDRVLSRKNTGTRADMILRLDALTPGVYVVKTTFSDNSLVTRKIVVE
ncbi:MAG: lamin tail domain-containing protein [Bacteroidota bacterium]